MEAKTIFIKLIKILFVSAIVIVMQNFLQSLDWGIETLDYKLWKIELVQLLKNIFYGCIFVLFTVDNVTIPKSKYNMIPFIVLGLFASWDLLFRSILFAVGPYFVHEYLVGYSIFFQLVFGVWLALIIKSRRTANKS